jgi:hypothetical protein
MAGAPDCKINAGDEGKIIIGNALERTSSDATRKSATA